MEAAIYFSFAEESIQPDEEPVAKVVIAPKDWKDIHDAIDKAVTTAIAPLLAPPSKMRRLMLFMKDWGAISAIWAVPLSLLSIAVTAGVFAVNAYTANARFQGTTESRLTTIEKQLGEIHGDFAKQSLRTQAALPAAEFSATLPDLKAAVSTARTQNLKVDPDLITGLKSRMVSTDSDAPGYWPAAAELISYQSLLRFGVANAKLPPCRDIASIPNPDRTGTTIMMNSHCFIRLDGRSIEQWACRQCVVMYSGGSFSFRYMEFIDCIFVFDFSPTQVPALEGRKMSQTLLASNSEEVKIPSS